MPDIPAFCNNCGAIFRSGIFIGGGTATLVGNTAGPCPVCGSMGVIPDGVYSIAGNIINLLSGPHSSVEHLKRLASILNEARLVKTEPNLVAEKIREEAPELSSIIDVLPKTRSELYPFITLIFFTITVLIAYATYSNSNSLSSDDIEKLIEDSVEKTIQDSQKESYLRISSENQSSPSRNSQCPCGSGERYTRCCGKII